MDEELAKIRHFDDREIELLEVRGVSKFASEVKSLKNPSGK